MGGDGTVHRVANKSSARKAALRGNPGWHEQRLCSPHRPPRRSPATAEALAASRSVRVLSTARITAIGTHGAIDRIAIFAAGVGYDADKIRESERRPACAKLGQGPFIPAQCYGVALAHRRRPPDLEVTVDERHSAQP